MTVETPTMSMPTTNVDDATLVARLRQRRDRLLGWMSTLRKASEAPGVDTWFRRIDADTALALREVERYLQAENRDLVPVLRASAWAQERLAFLEAEHREEMALVESARERLDRGPLDADEIRDVLRDVEKRLRACFAEEDEMVLSWGAVAKSALEGV